MGRTGARPPLAGVVRTFANTKAPYATPEEEQQAHEAAVAARLETWRQHLPELFAKLARIPDPRRPGSVRHRIPVLCFYGLLLFVWQVGSRREANRVVTSPTLAETLREVFPDLDSIPHFDTVERLLRTIPVETWENLLRDRIQRLLRSHAVREYLVQRAWVVAVDGTEKFARHQPFAPEALRQRVSDSETRYRVYVLEAVLVAGDGVTLPLLTEFAENRADASLESKQDCELKAFRRLARRLKQWFPRRRLLLVLDGLYPNGPVIAECAAHAWDYMIGLPQSSLPSVWEEVEGLRRLDTTGENRREQVWGDRQQVFTWVNEIEYTWHEDGHTRRRSVHVALCAEQWTDADGVEHRTEWAWLSGRPLTADNVVARCNRAARHRWVIEAEFLVEKRHGDHFEHAYSYDWQAMKGWHYLLKIAHLLNVLTFWTTVGQTLVHYYGYQGAVRFFRDTWMGRWLSRAFLRANTIGQLAP